MQFKKCKHGIFWNTAPDVPCSSVSTYNCALLRLICLADHHSSDIPANVTLLFQSKAQQGVPSVWHSPSSHSQHYFALVISLQQQRLAFPWNLLLIPHFSYKYTGSFSGLSSSPYVLLLKQPLKNEQMISTTSCNHRDPPYYFAL